MEDLQADAQAALEALRAMYPTQCAALQSYLNYLEQEHQYLTQQVEWLEEQSEELDSQIRELELDLEACRENGSRR